MENTEIKIRSQIAADIYWYMLIHAADICYWYKWNSRNEVRLNTKSPGGVYIQLINISREILEIKV